MHIPKKFDVNTHGSLVRFLIKFVKEFNDLVKAVGALTETVEQQAIEALKDQAQEMFDLTKTVEQQAQEIGKVQQHATHLYEKTVALESKVAELAKKAEKAEVDKHAEN